MSLICPLCSSSHNVLFFEDKNRQDSRQYYRCQECLLVFVPEEFHLSLEEEKKRYDLHQNDPHDQGYRTFLSRLADPLISKLKPGATGLDFGCGPGPALATMLSESGFSVDTYDPFYDPQETIFSRRYDFITATEVLEHLRNPGTVLNNLVSMLHPGGIMGFMTKMVISQEAFATWHYILDPTHICFWSLPTFEWLSRTWGAHHTVIGSDVILFSFP